MKWELAQGILSSSVAAKLRIAVSENPTQSLRLYRKPAVASEWAGLVKVQAARATTIFPRAELLSADREHTYTLSVQSLLPFVIYTLLTKLTKAMDAQPTSRKRGRSAGTAKTPAKRQAITENAEPNFVADDQPEIVAKAVPTKKPKAKGKSTKSKSTKPKRKGREGKIENTLESLGVENPEGASRCLKAAISRGHIKILPPEQDPEKKHGLDQVILNAPCIECNELISCTIRDVLFQPDYAGTDYEEGGMDAPFKCNANQGVDDEEEEEHSNSEETENGCGIGIYVTRMCTGKPAFDSGKFHNHCNRCRGLGKCIGDYRETHCEKCNGHYFQGLMGTLPCHNCEQRRHRGLGFGFGFSRGFTLFDEAEDSDEEEEHEDCTIM